MRRLQGTIVSNKMAGTVVVRVDRLLKHSKYRKFFRVSNTFKAHDAARDAKVGDVVIIEESRPLSKEKRWRVAKRVSRAADVEVDETSAPQGEDTTHV